MNQKQWTILLMILIPIIGWYFKKLFGFPFVFTPKKCYRCSIIQCPSKTILSFFTKNFIFESMNGALDFKDIHGNKIDPSTIPEKSYGKPLCLSILGLTLKVLQQTRYITVIAYVLVIVGYTIF